MYIYKLLLLPQLLYKYVQILYLHNILYLTHTDTLTPHNESFISLQIFIPCNCNFVALKVFETKSKIIHVVFNKQIEKYICHHNRLKPSSDNLQKLTVGYSLIKIFVSFGLWGDNTKRTSKTWQDVPGLNKDSSHPFPSLATLSSSTIHMVGKTIETERMSKEGSL